MTINSIERVSVDAKHQDIVFQVESADNDFDRRRAATAVQAELERQRALIRKLLAKIASQKDTIEDQAELLDEAGVYRDDEDDDESM